MIAPTVARPWIVIMKRSLGLIMFLVFFAGRAESNDSVNLVSKFGSRSLRIGICQKRDAGMKWEGERELERGVT